MRFARLWEMQADNAARIIPYGIPFLDDATGGILPGQLIVLGAATGVGKTDALSLIARSAAKKTKVCFYALEAHEGEIEERIFYRVLSDIFFSLEPEERRRLKVGSLTFVDFHSGKLKAPLAAYWDEATAKARELIDNIEFIYPYQITASGVALDIQDRINDGFGLFILDHLHHLEFEEHEQETAALKKNMALLNRITNARECALITASHLRKADKFRPDFPDLHELHGSSEISKRAHAVILIGPPARGMFADIFGPDFVPTVFNLGKFRLEGARRFVFGLHGYGIKTRAYTARYALMRQTYDEKGRLNFELIETKQKPYWAKGGQGREELVSGRG